MDQPPSSSPMPGEHARLFSRSATSSATATPLSSRSQTQTPTPQGTGGDILDSLQNLSLSPAQQTALPPSSPLEARSPLPSATQRSPNKLAGNFGNEQHGKTMSGARLEASAPGPQAQSPRVGRTSLGAGVRRPSSSLENQLNSRTTALSSPLRKKSSTASIDAGRASTPTRPLSRRASSNIDRSPSGTMLRRASRAGSVDEKPASTPVTVAKSHFQRELELHRQAAPTTTPPRTIVILHDSCYGHRFARPRTSKSALSTIVERPERIHASVLGVSAAYVRLGGRHEGGRCPPRPESDLECLQQQPFRIQTTSRALELTSPAVTAVHGTEWMSELKGMCDSAERNLALTGKELKRSNRDFEGRGEEAEAAGAGAEKPILHEGDLYLCSGSLDAFQGALGGVCDGVDAVFSKSGPDSGPKRAFVCIRPPGHHCSADYPSGFCWVNNVHVGIAHATMAHGLTHAAIIDFDLHHGDGSQAIAWEHNAKVARLPKNASASKKTSIGYFSLHDINSYPCEWGDDEKVRSASLCLENAHGQTVWNVHLQPWKNDLEFWDLYRERYSILLDKARAYLRAQTQRILALPNHPMPKAAIFISAGFDASEWESPGMQRHKVNVPTEFYARFTADIVRLSEEEGLGVDGRVISVLEGGYSDRALSSGVWSHICGLAATNNYSTQVHTEHGLGYEMHRRMSALKLGQDENNNDQSGQGLQPFDPAWWDLKRLEELEKIVYPPAPPPAPKKRGNQPLPQYAIPTESFTAKIVASPKGYRNFSSGTYPFQAPAPAPIPPPIPLDVDWATATHELSKLLIPSDRETRSCRPEELNAEASRKRRERHSIGLPVQQTTAPAPLTSADAVDAGPRRSLRDRRGKTPNYNLDSDDDKLFSGASRRQTIATTTAGRTSGSQSPSTFSQAGAESPGAESNPARRLSSASNMTTSSVHAGVGENSPSIHQVPVYGSTTSTSPAPAPAIPRPGSAMTSASLHNNRSTTAPHGQAPLIKKTRFIPSSSSNPTKPEPATTNRATKAARPRPALPARSLTSPTPGGPSSSQETAVAVQQLKTDDPNVSSTPPSGSADDNTLDVLSKGMKKMSIKLNVPSREEHEARERKRADGGAAKTKVSSRKPAAPRTRTVKKADPKQRDNVSATSPAVPSIPSPVSATNNEGPARTSPAGEEQIGSDKHQPVQHTLPPLAPSFQHPEPGLSSSPHISLSQPASPSLAQAQIEQQHPPQYYYQSPYQAQPPQSQLENQSTTESRIQTIRSPPPSSTSTVTSTEFIPYIPHPPSDNGQYPTSEQHTYLSSNAQGPVSAGTPLTFTMNPSSPAPFNSSSTALLGPGSGSGSGYTREFHPPNSNTTPTSNPTDSTTFSQAPTTSEPAMNNLIWLPPNTSDTSPTQTTSPVRHTHNAPDDLRNFQQQQDAGPQNLQQQHRQEHTFGQTSLLSTSPIKRREDLPVFTSTSAIPFATPPSRPQADGRTGNGK